MEINNLKSKYEEIISKDKTVSKVDYYKNNQKVKKAKKKFEKEQRFLEKLKKSNDTNQ